MKPSELLLKALETELAAPPYETFDVSKEIENRRIRLFLQDSGVLDVLDAAFEAQCMWCQHSAKLDNARAKIRERLGEG